MQVIVEKGDDGGNAPPGFEREKEAEAGLRGRRGK